MRPRGGARGHRVGAHLAHRHHPGRRQCLCQRLCRGRRGVPHPQGGRGADPRRRAARFPGRARARRDHAARGGERRKPDPPRRNGRSGARGAGHRAGRAHGDHARRQPLLLDELRGAPHRLDATGGRDGDRAREPGGEPLSARGRGDDRGLVGDRAGAMVGAKARGGNDPDRGGLSPDHRRGGRPVLLQ